MRENSSGGREAWRIAGKKGLELPLWAMVVYSLEWSPLRERERGRGRGRVFLTSLCQLFVYTTVKNTIDPL